MYPGRVLTHKHHTWITSISHSIGVREEMMHEQKMQKNEKIELKD